MPPAQWLVEPLGRNHDRADFSCGNEILDAYLKELARQDERRRVAAPFVAVEKTAPSKILGYYTLSASRVELAEVPPDAAKKLPRYPHVPVTLIGRLAVDLRWRGRGLGEFLLMDALHRSLRQSSEIGAAAMIVDAVDDTAARFYKRFQFTELGGRASMRLYVPMQDVAELFK